MAPILAAWYDPGDGLAVSRLVLGIVK